MTELRIGMMREGKVPMGFFPSLQKEAEDWNGKRRRDMKEPTIGMRKEEKTRGGKRIERKCRSFRLEREMT